jgi:DNA-binding NarL/FixJ family response regulator
MPPIKISIADDHSLFREGVEFILRNEGTEVIASVANGQELLNSITVEGLVPDVILMDLKMPVMDGIEATQRIKTEFPDIKVVILTMHHEENIILHLLDVGANGYLLKNSSSSELLKAIKNVVEKDFYFTDYISSVMLKGLKKQVKPSANFGELQSITIREKEVLRLICEEYTTTEMAEKLFVSDRTIETHRKSLLEKLNAKNTAGLIVKALKLQVIDI